MIKANAIGSELNISGLCSYVQVKSNDAVLNYFKANLRADNQGIAMIALGPLSSTLYLNDYSDFTALIAISRDSEADYEMRQGITGTCRRNSIQGEWDEAWVCFNKSSLATGSTPNVDDYQLPGNLSTDLLNDMIQASGIKIDKKPASDSPSINRYVKNGFVYYTMSCSLTYGGLESFECLCYTNDMITGIVPAFYYETVIAPNSEMCKEFDEQLGLIAFQGVTEASQVVIESVIVNEFNIEDKTTYIGTTTPIYETENINVFKQMLEDKVAFPVVHKGNSFFNDLGHFVTHLVKHAVQRAGDFGGSILDIAKLAHSTAGNLGKYTDALALIDPRFGAASEALGGIGSIGSGISTLGGVFAI